MKKIMNKRNIIDYIILIVVASVIAIPMLNGKLNIYRDDGIQHIARAYGTLSSGNIFSNIIPSFSNNFGYSWNLFYGPLSVYGIILFKIIFGTYAVGYKFFTYICLILSGIFMYRFVSKVTDNNNIAVLAGSIYISFPYHITDLYIRNALGEYVSFIFIPLVFLGLYNLFNSRENNYSLIIGSVGLILTHNLSTVITMIFAVIYLLINIKRLKEKYIIKTLIINIVFILVITSFFWIPLLETKMITNYRVYEKGAMSTIEETANHAISIKNLFATGNKEAYVFELGLHVILMFVFAVMSFNNLKENRKEYIFFLIAGIICVWMSTKLFPWKIMPESISIIQFPWRMLQFAGFFLSYVCAVNMGMAIKNYNFKDMIIIICICLIYVMALRTYIPYTENLQNINEYKLGIISGKEDEIIAGTAKSEYLPTNAYNNRFYLATREDNIYVLEGKAIIEEEYKYGTYMKAHIKTIEEKTEMELPYIYYPGYEVRTDGIIVKPYETENGMLGVTIESNDEAEIEVKYMGTKLMNLSMIISALGLIIFAIYYIKRR